jgi:hypothetical protein
MCFIAAAIVVAPRVGKIINNVLSVLNENLLYNGMLNFVFRY